MLQDPKVFKTPTSLSCLQREARQTEVKVKKDRIPRTLQCTFTCEPSHITATKSHAVTGTFNYVSCSFQTSFNF